jgi:hypothetical protein
VHIRLEVVDAQLHGVLEGEQRVLRRGTRETAVGEDPGAARGGRARGEEPGVSGTRRPLRR